MFIIINMVKKKITNRHGYSGLFIFIGWDELPCETVLNINVCNIDLFMYLLQFTFIMGAMNGIKLGIMHCKYIITQ